MRKSVSLLCTFDFFEHVIVFSSSDVGFCFAYYKKKKWDKCQFAGGFGEKLEINSNLLHTIFCNVSIF
jgi:hypothetical protein